MTRTSFIHPSAIIEPGASIGPGCHIGPYCSVGKNVVLGTGVELLSHVVVTGFTSIGDKTTCYPFSSIGHIPQDLKYKGEDSKLEIGTHNIIREHVTIQPGTHDGGMITTIGHHNLFMASSHVAHDCHVGSHIVMANNATLAGHVIIQDRVIIGGLSAVRQFVRIGENAMISGMTGIINDVIPFGLVFGNRGVLEGLNIVGMKRRQLSREKIIEMNDLYKKIFHTEGTIEEKVEKLLQKNHSSTALLILNFLRGKAPHGYCLPKRNSALVFEEEF